MPKGFVFHFKLFKGLVPRSTGERKPKAGEDGGEGEGGEDEDDEIWAAFLRGIAPARARMGFVLVQLPLGFAPSPVARTIRAAGRSPPHWRWCSMPDSTSLHGVPPTAWTCISSPHCRWSGWAWQR